jgi:hypothetical protein
MQVEAGKNIWHFFKKKNIFDTALNFSEVDLPYPAWNLVKTL